MVQRNPNAIHRAVIWVYAEVHEVLKTGECAGDPSFKVERFPIAIDSCDQEECVKRLQALLKELKDKCSQN